MNGTDRRETIKRIIILVAPPEAGDFQPVARTPDNAMIERQEHRFEILGFVGAERRVEVGPPEELRLVSVE